MSLCVSGSSARVHELRSSSESPKLHYKSSGTNSTLEIKKKKTHYISYFPSRTRQFDLNRGKSRLHPFPPRIKIVCYGAVLPGSMCTGALDGTEFHFYETSIPAHNKEPLCMMKTPRKTLANLIQIYLKRSQIAVFGKQLLKQKLRQVGGSRSSNGYSEIDIGDDSSELNT